MGCNCLHSEAFFPLTARVVIVQLNITCSLSLQEQECLNVPGETALSQENHNAWLMIHGSEDARFRDRLLATAKARHEKIIGSSLTESLHMFSYLATEGAVSTLL